MIIVEKEIKEDIIGVSINNQDLKDSIFFDIETTGLSSRYAIVYLIGCVYTLNGQFFYKQWFIDKESEEKELIINFCKFIHDYNSIIHFNGNTFDIPFLIDKINKYELKFDFKKYNSIDYYKILKPLKNILALENSKQKSFEKFLKIKREDKYDGGKLIKIYKEYIKTKNNDMFNELLLHNFEDIKNLVQISKIQLLCNMFLNNDNKFLDDSQIYYEIVNDKDYKNNDVNKLCIKIFLDEVFLNFKFENIKLNSDNEFFIMDGNKIIITSISNKNLFKMHFNDYKNYLYLISEDEAIPKSLGKYADKNNIKPANNYNCYTWFKPYECFNESKNIKKYIRNTINYMIKEC